MVHYIAVRRQGQVLAAAGTGVAATCCTGRKLEPVRNTAGLMAFALHERTLTHPNLKLDPDRLGLS